MKKLIGVILVVVALLAGCADTMSPETAETPSKMEISLLSSGLSPIDDRVALMFGGEGEITFYHVPEIIYSTTGAENGLTDTCMYVTGIVRQLEMVEDYEIAIIETNEGTILLSLERERFNTYGLSAELELLQIGREFGFFFQYLGFSGVYEMAVGELVGLHSDTYIVEQEPDNGIEMTIEELNIIHSDVDGVAEFSFEADNSDKLVARIVYSDPYDVNDFPVLVVAFVDNIIRVADERGVLVSNLNIGFNQSDRILDDNRLNFSLISAIEP